MFVVALVALRSGPLEDELPALAAELGLAAYDAGRLVRAGLPAIVLRTEDREIALDLLGRLRARGHEAVPCDADALVSSEAMTSPRAFRLEADALVSVGPSGTMDSLRYAEIFAIVRAIHQTRTESVVKSQELKFSLGRSALSGGLLNTKVVTTETASSTDSRHPVAYLFRRAGAPWLLQATRTRYDGLGAEAKLGQLENFEILLARLRAAAPHALYDERLLSVRGASGEKLRTARTGQHVITSASTVDLLAYVLATSLARQTRGT